MSHHRARARLLPDGKRLHLQDGPIDLVIGAEGERDRAFAAATARFATVLDELCAELPLLRQPPEREPEGAVARGMWQAVLPYAAEAFITPMAAVAGAVADAVLAAMRDAARLDRAFVNNGGDIALFLAPGRRFRIGAVDRPDHPALAATASIGSDDGVGGIATSGWRGRSFSLGIADAVTILAADAAGADAAATAVANAVDLPGHPAVTRQPAQMLQPDSDLGERRVTVAVGPLGPGEAAAALEAGAGSARVLCASGRIEAALLRLAGETRVVRGRR